MADRVIVIGYDGGPLSTHAVEALKSATLVAGAERLLDAVPVPEAAERVVLGNVHVAAQRIGAHRGAAVVVAAGDPGFFGIVRVLNRPEYGLEMEIVPAVSSVAQAFARARMPWDDARIVSAVGRDVRRAANVCRVSGKVAVLTGPGAGPAELAAQLHGLARTFVICENLGTDREEISMVSAEHVLEREWVDVDVVIVIGPTPRAGTAVGWVAGERAGFPGPVRGWAMPEDAYAHRSGAITRAEVRALVLARIGPRLGDLVWDVGAGSGSVAVECARHGAAVVAVEQEAFACDLIAENAGRFGVEVAVVHGKAPDALARLPLPDVVFVGAGGPRVLAACAARRPERIVAAFTEIDRVGEMRAVLERAGFLVDGCLLQSSRMSPVSGGARRLDAGHPVFVVWGDRS
ncbi:precorrin-6y C5,15-methyltransferase (decarboxylating) subunit CbiE [Streptomyces sp. SID3343]|uniref:precorrin-6y C5,15-methyltransferase (decarboxylating) subunit CbiE n=1 Tax=Streptomyces sp. SID3343 TaxID=2690260 RepID=UPI0013712213|nr:precorrin-6y C5,15-methyltransferase (decarboxylating) subunit CbiE [Streptomyces sp. SID3343]MYW04867.1 precorrin-6y C5,15-methyltransferase (decarboxylating) subunit CbiE [Streptomyces sp. SID3343]